MSDGYVQPFRHGAEPRPFKGTPGPSPRYCLRQAPGGSYFMIPYIYDFGWSEYWHAWKPQVPGQSTACSWDIPTYAKAVDLSRLTFEQPLEAPEA